MTPNGGSKNYSFSSLVGPRSALGVSTKWRTPALTAARRGNVGRSMAKGESNRRERPKAVVATAGDAGRSCPYCRFPFKEGAAVLRCPSCNSDHHRECWEDNGGCSVLACASRPRDGEGGGPATPGPVGPAPVEDSAPGRQRQVLLAVGAAAILAFGVAAGVVLSQSGSDESAPAGQSTDARERKTDAADAEGGRVKLEGQVVLKPVGGGTDAGIAVVAQKGGEKQLIVQARLPANKNKEAYEVWLFNAPDDARSLGAQVTDKDGNFQGAGPLPRAAENFRFVDVSLERVDTNRAHSGRSVLRAALEDMKPVPPGQAGSADGQP